MVQVHLYHLLYHYTPSCHGDLEDLYLLVYLATPWVLQALKQQLIGGFKVSDAITKHNKARGANTLEFPTGKFEGGANTMVKTIDSRWRQKP